MFGRKRRGCFALLVSGGSVGCEIESRGSEALSCADCVKFTEEEENGERAYVSSPFVSPTTHNIDHPNIKH